MVSSTRRPWDPERTARMLRSNTDPRAWISVGDRASIGSAQSQEGPFSVEERRASMARPPTSERTRGFTSLTLPEGEEPRRRHRVGPWSPVTSVVLVPALTGGDTGSRVILGTSRVVRVFAYPAAVDLRKGYDGLYGLVQTGLKRDPLSGELFLFVNQSRKRCKILSGTAPDFAFFKTKCLHTAPPLIGRCTRAA